MKNRAAGAYAVDCVVIWTALLLMWLVLGLVLLQTFPLTPERGIRTLLVCAAALAGIFCTSALVSLLLHLRRHHGTLYAEGIARP